MEWLAHEMSIMEDMKFASDRLRLPRESEIESSIVSISYEIQTVS